jgi:hypothetical protein
MGTRAGSHNRFPTLKPRIHNVSVEPNVAQIAHPWQSTINSTQAARLLPTIARLLPSSVLLLLTGGGVLTLARAQPGLSPRQMRSAPFLNDLHNWTLNQINGLIATLRQTERDWVVGVDVLVNGHGTGQFALVITSESSDLIWKSFPVGDEDQVLAGFGSATGAASPRIVNGRLGRMLVLICHDAQAFNHRQLALVGRARQPTARGVVISHFRNALSSTQCDLVVNPVHWINGPVNAQTFLNSYKHIRTDLKGRPDVVGSFGYRMSPGTAGTLLATMHSSHNLRLSQVILQ